LQNLWNCSQNKTGSEFAELRIYSQNSYFTNTNPTFAEFTELLTKQKRFRICRTQKLFPEFILSQTQTPTFAEFAELLTKQKERFRILQNAEILGIQFFTNKTKICRIVKKKKGSEFA